jgi:electron transfer flavoprotein alpha subunit
VERQIGATGKFINADIYMPIGISGSNRHTSGIRNVKHVVPINIHKEAPIFKFAELGVVNDLYEVVPHLIKIIRRELEANGELK